MRIWPFGQRKEHEGRPASDIARGGSVPPGTKLEPGTTRRGGELPKDDHDEKKNGDEQTKTEKGQPAKVGLNDAVGAILHAITDAQQISNSYTTKLYKSESETGVTEIPQTQIESVRVLLRVALQSANQRTDGTQPPPTVILDSDYISTLPAASLSELEFNLRVFQNDASAGPSA